MKNKKIIILIVILVAAGLAIYFTKTKKPEIVNTNTNQPATTTPPAPPVSTHPQYRNTEYGFSMNLPDTWKGFEVIEDEWKGDSLDDTNQVATGTTKGPIVSIRHPDWEYKSPRQDIPIMVFTISQWNNMQADKFHIGAAPINPSEIGRNSRYVFAIPARYNFAYLTGYEEVDQIIRGDNFDTF